MKKASYWLLAGLIIMLFAQCQKESLGLGLIPEKDKLTTNIIDTVTVELITEPDNHINTYNKNFVLLGRYKDPVFGVTTAGFATQVIQTKYPEHTDNVVVDSVKLTIYLDKQTVPYGNIYDGLPVKVYKLTDTINKDKYYSDESPDDYTNYELLGEDTYYIYKNGNDSTFTIKLNTDFAQELFDNSDYYFFSEDDPFTNRFYGLYITPAETADDNLFMLKLNISSSYNTLDIYYHLSDQPDSNYVYPLSLFGSLAKHFSLISHDYSGTDVFNPSVDSVAYLQSLAGTKIKLLFPYIENLRGIVVEKAELVLKLTPSEYTYQATYPPLQTVFFARYYTNNPLPYSVDDFYSPTTGYEGINLSQDQYRINITRIVQRMIDGTDQIPDSTFNYYIYDLKSGENILRSVINTQHNSDPSKLVIIYSQPN